MELDSHFLAYMYRLKHIKRWSLMRNTVKENVAEHSYQVALVTHMLCTIANEIYHRDVPTEQAVCLALFHDATEMFTGDIPTPVKHHNPKILSNFREIEQLAAEKLVQMVPEPLRNIYSPLLINTEDHPAKKYVKAADLIDAYLKCATEVHAGNPEFESAKHQIEQKIKKLEMPEVDYFLTHLAPSFHKTLDEMAHTIESPDNTSK